MRGCLDGSIDDEPECGASPSSPAASSSASCTSRSGSGSVAQTPVRISSASCTVRSLCSKRSSSSSEGVLWSVLGEFFKESFSSAGIES